MKKGLLFALAFGALGLTGCVAVPYDAGYGYGYGYGGGGYAPAPAYVGPAVSLGFYGGGYRGGRRGGRHWR